MDSCRNRSSSSKRPVRRAHRRPLAGHEAVRSRRKRTWSASLVGWAILVCLARAQQLPYFYQAPGVSGSLVGGTLMRAGDLTGDGCADYWSQYHTNTVTAAGMQLRDGRTGAVLLTAPHGSSSLPNPVPATAPYFLPGVHIGDANGDGFDDFLCVSTSVSSYGLVSGAYLSAVLSGTTPTTPAILYSVAAAQSANIGPVALGDVDGDTMSDFGFLYYTSGGGSAGITSVEVRSGATGSMLATVPVPGQLAGVWFFKPLGDVNADGYGDIGVANSVQNTAAVISGEYVANVSQTIPATPLFLANLTPPTPADSFFGAALSSVGDLNGDGRADFVVGCRDSTTSPWKFRFHTFDSATWTPIVSVTTEAPFVGDGSLFGRTVNSGGDMNGDGLQDLVVGSGHFNLTSSLDYVYVHSAVDGAALRRFGDPPSVLSGWTVRTIGDTNGDGLGDLVFTKAGDPNNGLGPPIPGMLYAACIAGASPYGVPTGPAPLSLTWSGAPFVPTGAEVVGVTGATPWNVGVVAVSTEPANTTVGGASLFVDLSTAPNAVIPIAFDGAGSWSYGAPLFDLGRDEITYCLQIFEVLPLRASNALELLFSN